MFGVVKSVGIAFKPIGYVIVDAPDEMVRDSLEGLEGFIEVLPEYENALKGLEGFSHIIVIAYLHKVTEEQRRTLLVRPRRFLKLGIPLERIPEIGVFATDSPHRPNPIALSIVELLEVSGRRLRVRKLDLYNGTPILDIKSYTFSRRIDDIKVPEWYLDLRRLVKTLRPDIEL